MSAELQEARQTAIYAEAGRVIEYMTRVLIAEMPIIRRRMGDACDADVAATYGFIVAAIFAYHAKGGTRDSLRKVCDQAWDACDQARVEHKQEGGR